MCGLLSGNASSTIALPSSDQKQELSITNSMPESKPKKKICCACPETKKLRDECIVQHGQDACGKWIEAHRQCLRAEGFNACSNQTLHAVLLDMHLRGYVPSKEDMQELCIRRAFKQVCKMDSFSISNIKAEKANAINKHRQIQKIAGFLRVLEVCLVLTIISRFTIQLPIAVKNSGEYFKGLSLILASPCFVFVLGNAIVITLFAKSGQFSGQDSNAKTWRNDIYEEFTEKSTKSHRDEPKTRGKHSDSVSSRVIKETCASLECKNYQRSLSDNDIKRPLSLKPPLSPKPIRELRRSSTETCTKSIDYGEGWVKISYPEDRMSNEEFRSTVEAFIARQKRFRIDEENSVF